MAPKMDWRTERAFRAGLVALYTSCGFAVVATLAHWATGSDLHARTAGSLRAAAMGAATVVGCIIFIWFRSIDDRDRDPPAEPAGPTPSGTGGTVEAARTVRPAPTERVR